MLLIESRGGNRDHATPTGRAQLILTASGYGSALKGAHREASYRRRRNLHQRQLSREPEPGCWCSRYCHMLSSAARKWCVRVYDNCTAVRIWETHTYVSYLCLPAKTCLYRLPSKQIRGTAYHSRCIPSLLRFHMYVRAHRYRPWKGSSAILRSTYQLRSTKYQVSLSRENARAP